MSFDPASESKLLNAYPDVALRARRLEQDVKKVLSLQIRITEVIRTFAYQAELFAKGRTAPGPGVDDKHPFGRKVTNAKSGESIHHYGLAFDVCFAGKDPYLEDVRKRVGQTEYDRIWRAVGKCGEGNGLVWGYDWNGNGIVDGNDFDRPHFQITYGHRMQEIRELFAHGGIPAVWAAMDKVRGVDQGLEWNGITTKSQILEVGTLI